jgi:hypothetical protein
MDEAEEVQLDLAEESDAFLEGFGGDGPDAGEGSEQLLAFACRAGCVAEEPPLVARARLVQPFAGVGHNGSRRVLQMVVQRRLSSSQTPLYPVTIRNKVKCQPYNSRISTLSHASNTPPLTGHRDSQTGHPHPPNHPESHPPPLQGAADPVASASEPVASR